MANTRRSSTTNTRANAKASNTKASDSKQSSKPSSPSKNIKKKADIKDANKKSVKSKTQLPAGKGSTSKKPSTPVRVQMLTPPVTPRKSIAKRKLIIPHEPASPSPSSKKSKALRERSEEEEEGNWEIRDKPSKNTPVSGADSKSSAKKRKKGDEVGLELNIRRMVYLCDLLQTSVPSPEKDETLIRSLMSPFMKNSYKNLPNLVKADVDHSSANKILEYWSPESIFKMNPVNQQLYYAALAFSQSGRMFNLSRADPQHLTVPMDTLLCINANASNTIAHCVTTILVEKCHLFEPTNFGNSGDRWIKSISGYPDHFEWNREEAVLYMAYGIKNYNLRVYEKCLQFGTMPSVADDSSATLKNYVVQSGRSSKSVGALDSNNRRNLLRSRAGMKNADTSGKGDRVLSCSDKVPIYDGRNAGIELFDNLGNIDTNLHECDHDLEFGDVAVVVYTVNKYASSTGSVYLNFNIRCAILIGSPDDSSNSRNVSVDSEVEEVDGSDLEDLDKESEIDSADEDNLLPEGDWSESEKEDDEKQSENLSEQSADD